MKIGIITISALLTLAVSGAVEAKKDKKEKHKKLPPGLHKKAEQGKPLPPGWQKKLKQGETLDADVYRRAKVVVPVDDKGIITVEIEGRVIRLIEASREIVNIFKSI